MTRTRLLAALVMAPVAIAAILLLPTPWLAGAGRGRVPGRACGNGSTLAGIEDTLARTVLLVANLALMVAIVWASRSAPAQLVLFQLAA